jgi:hypothetical protein
MKTFRTYNLSNFLKTVEEQKNFKYNVKVCVRQKVKSFIEKLDKSVLFV